MHKVFLLIQLAVNNLRLLVCTQSVNPLSTDNIHLDFWGLLLTMNYFIFFFEELNFIWQICIKY